MRAAQRKHLQQLVGLSLIALVLLMGMAAAHPGLHQALHKDHGCSDHCENHSEKEPDNDEHICGVTLLQIGALLLIDPPILEGLGQVREIMERSDDAPRTRIAFGLPLGRAPPIAELV